MASKALKKQKVAPKRVKPKVIEGTEVLTNETFERQGIKITKVKPAKSVTVIPMRSILHGFHPQDPAFLSAMRKELTAYYGKERPVGRKTLPALKGKELRAAVEKQMRFMHPGLVAMEVL